MTLAGDAVAPPHPVVLPVPPPHSRSPSTPTPPAPVPPAADGPPDAPAAADGLARLIEAAEQLRASLADAAARAGHLAAGLKKQRQQSRAVEAAMASLRRHRALSG